MGKVHSFPLRKDPFSQLLQWSELTTSQLVFDSDTDGEDQDRFLQCILKKENLYVIVIDEFDTIFGIYLHYPLMSPFKYPRDPQHFIFSMKKKNKQEFIRFLPKQTSLNKSLKGVNNNKNCLFICGDDSVCIWNSRYKKSYIWEPMRVYEMKENKEINGTEYPNLHNLFSIQRIIVIQMK
ncbi:hypothetical protein KM1_158680 [Entamoeba histolytica HM-3:IMSS]|uniref:TLDc domain-containing protein n=5 Tax=Entamoeba histolytica TaxID=5759 RepID=C4M293_ENTH1|nr:hypothetical protein EHI_180440 [Entamoeba histolytica HM-1:IMSS]EMD46144.1 Hypothetical protein EHI5A_117250 [Entamoeba histolytica KU27]EMS13202.1 hypothetical protein KM1_158680 [Entamoeba histolytica HM-3:IMSS]ENY61572.1 hypothetical protein EHI7A_078180 [Entamoeba histolytica HM-1:IMSS-A]GAT95389.1 hypothetical protein CL6EHI_180440 [Entamoeba histolytica]EAL48427.1 hypothetical protein EHI_180440 [Entamoeba histolytica HM-1:IMSS]|eukprot:XP_653813.1 hypothetical protein EHI_180440 [Entamoeba histolytica HM-1:IMSS]